MHDSIYLIHIFYSYFSNNVKFWPSSNDSDEYFMPTPSSFDRNSFNTTLNLLPNLLDDDATHAAGTISVNSNL